MRDAKDGRVARDGARVLAASGFEWNVIANREILDVGGTKDDEFVGLVARGDGIIGDAVFGSERAD